MKTIFLSDLHIGTGAPWDWCQTDDRDRVCRFLQRFSGRDDTEVVILGDLFDCWIWPSDSKPPTMAEIIAGPFAAPVLEALATLPKLVIVRGNHDSTLTADHISKVLPLAGYLSCYARGDLFAEHGHDHGIFCADDPAHAQNLPIGYFISRLAAKADRDTGGHSPTRAQIVREIVDAGTGQDCLTDAILDAIAARAGVGPDDPILMPDDIWTEHPDLPLRAVRDTYARLVHDWDYERGAMGIWLGIAAEVGALEASALSRRARLVVCGHTHRPEVKPFLGRTYANCGAWSNRGPASWIEYDGQDLKLCQEP